MIQSKKMKTLKKICFLLLVIQYNIGAVTPFESSKIEQILNKEFNLEIKASGNDSLEIFFDETVPTYAGGVNLKNNKIVVTIGSEQALDYTYGAFSFIVCHELGHIIGGRPYKDERLAKHYKDSKISTEGQSDYWAGSICLKKITDQPKEAAFEFFKFLSLSLRDLVGDNPFYAIPSDKVVDEFYYDSEYPSFQCRYQSAKNGIENLARPNCWYKEELNL